MKAARSVAARVTVAAVALFIIAAVKIVVHLDPYTRGF